MASIRILEPHLANQIAAGEVVERPASVVKELLENAIDANSTQISVQIDEGGIKSIKIRDNGSGIPENEMGLAFMRHATSKIQKTEDLFNLHSFGFRGEALASIASVSHVKIASCLKNASHGFLLELLNPNDLLNVKPVPVACASGTLIEISDLFYNVPVRKKFLKSIRSEFLCIQDIVSKVALAHSHIQFKLLHNGKQCSNWPALAEKQFEDRIRQVLGTPFMKAAHYFETQGVGLKVFGWIATPEPGLSVQERQYVFVNGRPIRDRVVQHAIRHAWTELGYGSESCRLVLYIELEPHRLDVNVHPTKHEIRFHEPTLIHDMVYESLLKAFGVTVFSQQDPVDTSFQRSFKHQQVLSLNKIDFPSEPPKFLKQVGGYLIWEDSSRLYVADSLPITNWWLKTQFISGAWPIYSPLKSAQILNLGTKFVNILDSTEGKKIFHVFGLQGRALNKDEWILETFPYSLDLEDRKTAVETLCLVLSYLPSLTQVDLTQILNDWCAQGGFNCQFLFKRQEEIWTTLISFSKENEDIISKYFKILDISFFEKVFFE